MIPTGKEVNILEKKIYTAPELIVHGDVEVITLGANCTNSDMPAGPTNNAYPRSGTPCQA